MLLYIVIILLILFYFQCSLKKKTDIQILQTSLNNFSDSLLYEKYPILIYDKIVNSKDLLSTIFKYQYTFKKEEKYELYNKNRFLIIYNNNDKDITISISNKNDIYVDIKLKQNNVIILPAFWYYKLSDDIELIGLNDFVHWFYFHIN